MEEFVTSEEATSADVEKEIQTMELEKKNAKEDCKKIMDDAGQACRGQQAHAGQGRRPHRDHRNASRLRADMEREIQTVELEEKDAQEDC